MSTKKMHTNLATLWDSTAPPSTDKLFVPTMDESCIHYFERLEKFKMSKSEGKLMTSAFRKAEGIIMVGSYRQTK